MQLSTRIARVFLSSAICLLVVNFALLGQNKPQSLTQTPSASLTPIQHGGYTTNIKTNYVKEWTPMGAYSNPAQVVAETYQHVQQKTQYFDGLGRPLQIVARQISPTAMDAVTPVTYDSYGREEFKYGSYVQSTGTNTADGRLKLDPFGSLRSFYQNDYRDANNQLMFPGEQFFYGKTNYEASPLNRVDKTMAPGNSWSGSNVGVELKYLVNTVPDGVRIWSISYDPLNYVSDDATNIPQSPGSYIDPVLFKTVTKDESGKAVVEYKNKEGQVILKKVQIGNVPTDFGGHDNWLCTYYVYDDMGRLRFVIPPKAVDIIKPSWILTSDVINELCFRYEYDERSRMIAKKIPGAGWTYMIYDIRDRLVFVQDAKMRTASPDQWMTTLYDDLNRPVVTGIMTYDISPTSLQQAVNTNTAPPASPNTSLQTDIILSSTMSGTKQAMRSITMIDGFQSADNQEFVAEINPGPGGSNGETTILEGTEVNKNPIPAGAAFVALTVTFYDNYDFTNNAYTTAYNSLLSAGTNLHAEPNPSSARALLNGIATGGKIRVIEDPNNLNSGKWLTTVNFYDEKGRVIQAHSENYSGGTDIQTSLYDFTGKVLSTYLAHRNPLSSVTETRLRTDYVYDHAGRLKEVWKVINDDDPKKTLITKNFYDAMGGLVKKELGRRKNPEGTYTNTPLETLDYTYNIRGWLKGINAGYSHPELSGASAESTRFFGFELSYDWGFDQNQLDGNIGGIRWRSKGDGEQRAYGFGYDNANRLLKADFTQNNSGWNTSAGIDFSMKMGDGINVSSAYDANGNIKAMKQWGLKIGGSDLIDDFTYSYKNSEASNKLLAVTESSSINTTDNKLGDFTDLNRSQDDYDYDVNGNLILDKNKSIGSITYNHLNLPYQVTVTGKGTITYTYDAAGNKLRKVTVDNTVSPSKTTITDYILGAVYENNVLQFIGQEEGRIRYKSTNSTFHYDYFIKDHLGNVRMVLTEELQQDIYPATTVEGTYSDGNSAIGYEKGFYTIDESKIVYKSEANDIPDYQNNNDIPNPYAPGNSGNSNVNNNSAKLYKLAAGGSAGVTGLGITLKVMSGDVIDIHGKSYYFQSASGGDNVPIPVNDIINGLFGAPGSSAGNKALATDVTGQSSLTTPVTNFLTDGNRGGGSVPKAYINYILFDENFKFVDGDFSRVGTSGAVKSHHNDAQMQGIEVAKNGYLYVYVSNESPVNVFFDNLQVVHTRGPILEETHYYSFGLTMSGISSKALNFGNPENKKNKFQDQELNDDLGVNYYEFKYRNHDPQIGRFIQIDPLCDKYVYNSTYAFSENKVTSHVELEGLESEWFGMLVAKYVIGYKNDIKNSMTALGNISTGQAGTKYDNTPIAAPFKDIGNKADLLNNQVALVQPHINNLEIVETIGSFAAGGEAAAAQETAMGLLRIAGGTVKGAVAETTMSEGGGAVMKTLMENKGLKESFVNGNFLITEATEDINVVRVFGGESKKEGSFFGFMTPSSSAEAENMYYLKAYRNDATQMTSVTIKKGTQFAIGSVSNGTGAQIFIPKELQSGNVIYSNVTKALK